MSSLIEDVTEKVAALFEEFRKYDRAWYTDPTRVDYESMLKARVKEVEGWSPEEREAFTAACLKERADYERINHEIRKQFERLGPDTFPETDPEAPSQMTALLGRVSDSYRYKREKKGASFVAIMLYLYACGIDHASWYGSMWLKCAIFLNDWRLAEIVMKALTQEKGVRGEFAKDPEFRAWVPIGRAMILLQRDHDVGGALEYATYARDNCAEHPSSVSLFHCLARLAAEARQLEDGLEVGLDHLALRRVNRGVLTGTFDEGALKQVPQKAGESHVGQ